MIEKFKTNAEVIENGDKYLYGNHVRNGRSRSKHGWFPYSPAVPP